MNDNKRIKLNIPALFMIITPLLCAGLFALIHGLRYGQPFPGIIWNDEAAYVKLIETCVKTGQPIGYYGFDGNHAILGTGSAWSPAILWPYAIFALLFPVGQSFVYFVNLFYITLANFLFVLLVRPNWKNALRGIFFQATSAVLLLYLNVNMSEIFRFSLAIVLAGMFYRLFFLETPKWLKYIVMPIFILLTVQVYVFFAFCVPIYVWGILKGKKAWIKCLFALLAQGIVAGGSYFFLHLISSNYNIAKTEALLNALKEGQLFTACYAFLRMVKEGLIGVFSLWQYVYAYPLYPFHVIICILLAGIGILLLGIRKKELLKELKKVFMPGQSELVKIALENENKSNTNRDSVIGGMVIYSVLIFLFMYLSLYTIVPDTFMRGTYIVVIFSFYLLIMCDTKFLINGILLLNSAGIFLMGPSLKDFEANRFETNQVAEEWTNLQSEFEEVFRIDKEKNAWDNTVLMYTMEPKVICAIPAGMGINFVLTDSTFSTDCGYLLFTKHPADKLRADWVEKDYSFYQKQYGDELGNEYDIIYESNEYIIYKKRDISSSVAKLESNGSE